MKSPSALLLSVGLVVSGCMEQPIGDDEGPTDDATGAFETSNGYGANGIGANGIGANGIGANGIAANGISEESLSDDMLAAIHDPGEDGDEARLFMRYTVACAFKPSQSFDFTWTDADGVEHEEHYIGELGLASHWATGPLSERGQRMVSACLAAHVNYYAVPVLISMRSGEKPLKLKPHDSELYDFPYVEGAFWGNLWASTPYLNACYNPATVHHSREKQRDCAAGHLNSDGTIAECGIINVVGSCNTMCKKYNHWRGYYEDCRDQPGVNNKRTDLVITTALP